MNQSLCLSAVVLTLVAIAGAGQHLAPRKEVLAGWPGVFPDLPMYQRTFKQPEVSKDKKTYRQKANYQWTGGRLEDNDVTLAKGQPYIKDYTGAALLKNAEPPGMIKVGDFTGWQWKDKKLVVMLGQDKILLVEAKFEGNDLLAFASKFPLKACAKALDNPPRQ